MDIKDTAPGFLSDWQRGLVAGIAAFRDAILALAPADALAEVEKLRKQCDVYRELAVDHTNQELIQLARAEAAEAEVARLKPIVTELFASLQQTARDRDLSEGELAFMRRMDAALGGTP